MRGRYEFLGGAHKLLTLLRVLAEREAIFFTRTEFSNKIRWMKKVKGHGSMGRQWSYGSFSVEKGVLWCHIL